MKQFCVYCGSRDGSNGIYGQGARELGQALVKNNLELVFGGSQVGLMKTVADAVYEAGGNATGVVPTFLSNRIPKDHNLKKLHVVGTMHKRKAKMVALADGFIAMPGGYGTLDEIFEIICWAGLKLHDKPIGLFNVNNYYDPLLTFLEHMTQEGFSRVDTLSQLHISANADELVEMMLVPAETQEQDGSQG